MDPNEALKTIRRIIEESNRTGKLPSEEDVDSLVTLVDGLDRWLSRGGFLPKAWQR